MKAKTTNKRGKTAEQRKTELDALRDQLGMWEKDTVPEVVAQVIALFEGYSERNAKLIAMQCPDATDVCGYREWQSRGRQVKTMDKTAGEHGIYILAPAGSYTVKGEADGAGEDTEHTEDTEHLRFRRATVFDVSMTKPADGADALDLEVVPS